MDSAPISLIQVLNPRNYRRNFINMLMESLDTVGLVNPIYLNSALELLDGRARLEAAIRLGWTTIHCIIWDRNGYIDPRDMGIRN